MHIIDLINRVDSLFTKCNLLVSLGLRALSNSNGSIFELIAKQIIKMINDIPECDSIAKCILIKESAPVIYEYERNILFDYFQNMDIDEIDDAVYRAFYYVTTKLDPNDSVDISLMRVSLDNSDILRACELITKLNNDKNIYNLITLLVDKISNSLNTVLEKSVLNPIEILTKFVKNKLPDNNNIMHKGYYICCLAKIRSLKKAVYNPRANWDSIISSWSNLINETRNIPNISDRIFVTIALGEFIFPENSTQASNLLEEASQLIDQIKNNVDKIDRLELIADAFKRLSITKSSKYYLEKAFELTSLIDDENREVYMKKIIEMAHAIDPNYGIQLANKIDNPYLNMRANERISILRAQSNAGETTKELNNQIIEEISSMLLSSCLNGRLPVYNDDIIGKKIYESVGLNLNTIIPLLEWFIENNLRRTKSLKISSLTQLYNNILDIFQLLSIEPETSAYDEAATTFEKTFSDTPRTNIHKILVGEKEQALVFIKQWLIENAKTYVKIYDPYFGPEEIKILNVLPCTIMIKIITSWRALRSSNLTSHEVKELYYNSWKQASDQDAMNIITLLIGTEMRGDGKEHDRYITADDAGLQIGTSINGLGNKETYIRELSNDEKVQVECETIDLLFSNPPLLYKGQRLRVEYIPIFS